LDLKFERKSATNEQTHRPRQRDWTKKRCNRNGLHLFYTDWTATIVQTSLSFVWAMYQ